MFHAALVKQNIKSSLDRMNTSIKLIQQDRKHHTTLTPNVPFMYPLRFYISKVFDVFRGFRKETLA